MPAGSGSCASSKTRKLLLQGLLGEGTPGRAGAARGRHARALQVPLQQEATSQV